jgi:hypothetical protein
MTGDAKTEEVVRFDYCRRFGSEIEVNAFDGQSSPAQEGVQPDGIQHVAQIVATATRGRCEIYTWLAGQKATDFNTIWMLKPDGSCGMEICSPVSKGLYGINQGARVITALRDSRIVQADSRCSLHIHVDVSDLTTEQVAAVLAHWVKCEYTMLLAMPDHRKKNRYCQPIGMSDLLRADSIMSPDSIITWLGMYKYYTANAFHYKNGKRPTLEFRIADEEACKNPEYYRNWHKLVLHLVETAVASGMPKTYNKDDPTSGYSWLTPSEVMRFLNFEGAVDLCDELKETCTWFKSRVLKYAQSSLGGIWDAKVYQSASKGCQDAFVQKSAA